METLIKIHSNLFKFVLVAIGILLCNPDGWMEDVAVGLVSLWGLFAVYHIVTSLTDLLNLRKFIKYSDQLPDLNWGEIKEGLVGFKENLDFSVVLFTYLTCYALITSGHTTLGAIYFVIQTVHLILVYSLLESKKQVQIMANIKG